MYDRSETSVVKVGNVLIGGGNPILIQSMTNTNTADSKATIEQILKLQDAGCEIIRVAVPDMESAEAIKDIKKNISIPLVADIHFDYKLALKAIENGVDKVRINPGNIGDRQHTKDVVKAAKERNIPIRIGINGGSLDKKMYEKFGKVAPNAMVESAMEHVNILEDLGFENIVISLKSTDINTTVKAYELMAEKRPYPLHVGLTEAGTLKSGIMKSSLLFGGILTRGIGDTVRVSLTGDPVNEVIAAKEILSAMGLRKIKMYNFISCPTCGRTRYDMIGTATRVENALEKMEAQGIIKKPITVAVMGCAVNGPGEAKEADIGLAGGDNMALMFKKGKIVCSFTGDSIAEQFIEKIKEFIEEN